MKRERLLNLRVDWLPFDRRSVDDSLIILVLTQVYYFLIEHEEKKFVPKVFRDLLLSFASGIGCLIAAYQAHCQQRSLVTIIVSDGFHIDSRIIDALELFIVNLDLIHLAFFHWHKQAILAFDT